MVLNILQETVYIFLLSDESFDPVSQEIMYNRTQCCIQFQNCEKPQVKKKFLA